MLFIASCFSYGDRVALSIAGTAMEKELALDPLKLGWLLSGFSWAYVRAVALGRAAGPVRIEAGVRHQHRAWSVCAFLIGFTGIWPRRGVQHDLRVAAALGAGADAGVSGQRADCGGVVSDGGARRSVGDLQRVAVLCAGGVCAAVWMADAHYGWRSCFWFMGWFGACWRLRGGSWSTTWKTIR
jgi:ACS family glucarate transporter-like MFS transporter